MESNKAKVLWRYPGELPCGVKGDIKELSIEEIGNENGWVLFPFNATTGILIAGDEIIYSRRSNGVSLELSELNNDETAVKQRLQNAIDQCKSGSVEKIVVAGRFNFQVKNPGLTADLLFDLLEAQYKNALCYVAQIGNEFWFGASPELLLDFSDHKVTSMALAGTRLADSALPFQQKEKDEHLMVANYVANAFNEVCGKVFTSEVFTRSAGPVKHLCKGFEGKNQSLQSARKLLAKLHPTPAVCGLPTEKAKKFILTHEPARAYYAGFMGKVSKEAFRFWVNLRSGKIKDQTLTIFSGAGITAASEVHREWEEICAKATTLISIFGAENPSTTEGLLQ